MPAFQPVLSGPERVEWEIPAGWGSGHSGRALRWGLNCQTGGWEGKTDDSLSLNCSWKCVCVRQRMDSAGPGVQMDVRRGQRVTERQERQDFSRVHTVLSDCSMLETC
ncbi:uncharacterized [Tachysurus ichikawai]